MASFAPLAPSVALAPIVVVGLIGAVAASDYRCARGDQVVRRVEVAVDDPVQNVPCEVVYWKDTEQPGMRTVLWSAEYDAAYCTRKADELVANLESGGWSCEPIEGASTEATRETRPLVVESPAAETADAAGAVRLESGHDEAKETTPVEPEPPAVRGALPPQRSELQPVTGAAGATEDKAADAVLEAIVEQNLVRLNDGVDGRFAAAVGGYGDLNGDGLGDGLVFFTYESERLGQARFVAAYLYDGKRYALVATKPVAGSDVNVHSMDIDWIEDGVISLRLSVLEPGDASCCPSGEQEQRLVLRDGQLVEVTSSARPTAGQAEQTLATKPFQEPPAPAVPRADGSGASEERAKSAGEERAAEAGDRQVETEAESSERAQPTTGRGAGAEIGPSQAAPAGKERIEGLGGRPEGTWPSATSLQAPAHPATPGAAARLQVTSDASSLDHRPAADIRVFIHHVAHGQEDAALARRLADHLRRRGFTVADIRPVDFSIGKPSVRYFFARDRAASRQLVEEVSRFFEETPSQAPDEASDFTHYVPKPRPGNVEVWLPLS
jgi:hypothetical protein